MLRNELYKPWFANENDWGFEILSGEFQGVVLQIEKLEAPDSSDGQVSLDFHIIHRPEIIEEESLKGDMFQSVLETIMNDILTEALEAYENDKNRNDNT